MTIRNRYPNADVLAQRGHWDDATRRVILDRVRNVPDSQFFTDHERLTLEALCGRVMPQAHRWGRQIPIAPWIDLRCQTGAEEGFRFDDMPPTGEAWRQGLAGLDQTAQVLFDGPFAALDDPRQDKVLERVRRGDPPGEAWTRLPARRWWIYVALRQISGIYYAHPFAWDEIGFGGPAYPRGYAALNDGAPETWEAREVGAQGKG